MEALDDRQLVEHCQKGDREAFAVLVRRHQQHAFNIAYGLLHNYEDAAEVTQDTFVRMYRSINSFRGEAEFTTWMYRIVVNLSRNHLRYMLRHGFHRQISLDKPFDREGEEIRREAPDPAAAPDEAIVKDELVRAVLQCMHLLPRKYREVLLLRNVENLSYEEIAKVLRCSVGTVKSRISRAREELRRRMGKELT